MKSSEDKNIFVNKKFKEKFINLDDLRKELKNEQFDVVRSVLQDAYPHTDIKNSWVMSCVELIDKEHDQIVYLPKDLAVEKNSNVLSFRFESRKKNFVLLLLFLATFLATAIGTIYVTLNYIEKKDLNKDIDKDGISDLNVDKDKDGKDDINIDTNNDKIPDLNIDYKGNRKAIFNLDKNKDGKADFNLVHDASTPEKRKTCSLNCDVNGDGWPNTNVDLDGDGKADVDIDIDGDGKPDLNLDIDGDGIPDILLDPQGIGECTERCLETEKNKEEVVDSLKQSGPSSVTGGSSSSTEGSSPAPGGSSGPEVTATANLVITYSGSGAPSINVLPNDMPDHVDIEDRHFTIRNESNYNLKYRLVWTNVSNDFQTEHLKYKITGTNGGISQDFRPVPKSNDVIQKSITIPAHVTQSYTLSFVLEGTHTEQNIDAGRTFVGVVIAEIDEQ